ncbi:LCP family protein [Branchiibius sp. NY16-3462-2]|uniref:LCP family protein n=1 Tax=Branchiibius sp. NY16-3462-2 TaxID=1807500 RepID=UPI0025BA9ED8|nr:LCP family protein [Branchiibius sp. NY16-3462-2]
MPEPVSQSEDSRSANRSRARTAVLRRRILAGVLVVLVAIGVTGGLLLHHLNGNIRTQTLVGAGTAKEKQTGPINILVMGSDTRDSEANCALGGGCAKTTATSNTAAEAQGANADVIMIVHIAADRSNATVLSIPRDTVVKIPACTLDGKTIPARTDRINASLMGGPSCTAQTVGQLTGITINHFVVIDFAGVVTMSDAVGGVEVCVDNNVYDTYSHLKLAKGTHTLEGKAALEFLRTRHGFGDGGDVGRTIAQHLFLSSMIRQVESAATLANPVKVYNLADAATKAVTVDDDLGSVTALSSLLLEIKDIPSNRITFVTTPTDYNPANMNELILAPNAEALFKKIADDVSLSHKKTTPTPTKTKSPGSSTSGTPSATPSASASSSAPDYATTADSATGCAQVSTYKTVTLKGVPMTPTRAYELSPDVPDSAN